MGSIKYNGTSKKILNQIHKHLNLDILNELNEDKGKLTYKGKEISSSLEEEFYLSANYIVENVNKNFVSQQQLNSLSGITDNIQNILNRFKLDGLKYGGRFTSYDQAIKTLTSPQEGTLIFIDIDETIDNNKTIYIYIKNKWERLRADDINSSGWTASNVAPLKTNLLWIDTSSDSAKIKYHNGVTWETLSGGNVSSDITISASKVVQENDLNFISDASKLLLSKLKEDPVSKSLSYDNKILGSGSGALIDDINSSEITSYSSLKIDDLLSKKQNSLSYIPESIDNKGMPNGYAPLNDQSIIPDIYLPEKHTSQNFVVFNVQERDSLLNINNGDKCYVSSLGIEYTYINNDWTITSDIKIFSMPKNNLNAAINPSNTDDNNLGYSIGSIWINKNNKESFICTDNTANNAVWNVMAGIKKYSIGAIEKFEHTVLEEFINSYDLPVSINPDFDFIELSVDGIELLKDKHYTIVEKENGDYYVSFAENIVAGKTIHGEIYIDAIKNSNEMMLKSTYDSNSDGKVDAAEYADIAKTIQPFNIETTYKKSELILKDDILYSAIANFQSGLVWDESKWNPIYAKIKNLNDFTTANLKETDLYQYVTKDQKTNINTIPSLKTSIDSTTSRVAKVESYIPSDTTVANKLVSTTSMNSSIKTSSDTINNKINSLKITNLTDVTTTLTNESFLKVTNNKVQCIKDPRFPIMKASDMNNKEVIDIYNLKFENAVFGDKDVNGKISITPYMRTTNLLDMPKSLQHGKILIANGDMLQYDLVDPKELTLSQENYSIDIAENKWFYNEANQRYEYQIDHKLGSENLIISFTDNNKTNIKDISYKILSLNSILVFSQSNNFAKCNINCSLGIVNGYWAHVFDYSKFSQIDDNNIRIDKTYSSYIIEDKIKDFIKYTEVYSRDQSNSTFAKKSLEHLHSNNSILNDINEDTNGNITYKNIPLLTSIEPKLKDFIFSGKTDLLSLVIDVTNFIEINQIGTILNSELLIQNKEAATGIEEQDKLKELNLVIKDGDIPILDIKLKPEETQKYQLGISPNLKISLKGTYSIKYYVAAL